MDDDTKKKLSELEKSSIFLIKLYFFIKKEKLEMGNRWCEEELEIFL